MDCLFLYGQLYVLAIFKEHSSNEHLLTAIDHACFVIVYELIYPLFWSNTGRFAKQTSCIRLPPHEDFAKQYIIYDRPPKPTDSIALYRLPGHQISTKIPRLQHHKELDELSEYDDCTWGFFFVVVFTTTKFSLYFLMFTVLYSILIGCNSSFCLICISSAWSLLHKCLSFVHL